MPLDRCDTDTMISKVCTLTLSDKALDMTMALTEMIIEIFL